MKRFAFFALLGSGPALALPSVQAQASATVTTLHDFSGESDESHPVAALVQGSDGNFYGTTYDGGMYEFGSVFQITPAGVLTSLHSFGGTGDGRIPIEEGKYPYASLVQGLDGSFYGVTGYGGSNNDGTIFQITPAGTLTTAYTFTGGDGATPLGAMVLDGSGDLFGATYDGGQFGTGTLFSYSPSQGTHTKLYDFSAATVGVNTLVEGSDGALYGTSFYAAPDGGSGLQGYSGMNDGSVFRFSLAGVLTDLYTFGGGKDGAHASSSLVEDDSGNFYGTTVSGGDNSEGTVYEVTPGGVLTTLHSFSGASDGASANSMILGSDGILYGTTSSGGASNVGTVFAISRTGSFTTLYSFTGGNDGANPNAALVQGTDGNFYGTTQNGGVNNDGTVFKLQVVSSSPAFFTGEMALGNGVYYLTFPTGYYFGYYSYLTDPRYIYHFDLGYEYVFDAADGKSGVYLYDFTSSDFFYTSPTFPFPYLYDFGLQSTLYYYPDTTSPGHYTTNPRYFFNFATGQIITK